MLLDGDGEVGAALDGVVVGDDHARNALDDPNAGHHAAGRHNRVWVQLMACQGRQLEECGAWVDEGGHAVARHHLAAPQVLVPRPGVAALVYPTRQLLDLGQGLGHERRVLAELIGARIDIGLDDGDGFRLVRRNVGGNGAAARHRQSRKAGEKGNGRRRRGQ